MIIDALLAISAISLAAASLCAKKLFTSIILFICLGLIITMIWARLSAVDVAIAEAAIGAGMTGALLLVTWHKLGANPSTTNGTSNNVS